MNRREHHEKVLMRETKNGYEFTHISESFQRESTAWIDVDVINKEIGSVSIQLLGSHTLLKTKDGEQYVGELKDVKLGRVLIDHVERIANDGLKETPERKEVTGDFAVTCYIRSLGHTEPVTRIVGWKKVTDAIPISLYAQILRKRWKEFDIPEKIQDDVLKMDSLTVWNSLKEMLTRRVDQNNQVQIAKYNALQQAYYFCDGKGFYKPRPVPIKVTTEGYTIKGFDVSVLINGKQKEVYKAGRLPCRRASGKTVYRYYFKVMPEDGITL